MGGFGELKSIPFFNISAWDPESLRGKSCQQVTVPMSCNVRVVLVVFDWSKPTTIDFRKAKHIKNDAILLHPRPNTEKSRAPFSSELDGEGRCGGGYLKLAVYY